MKKYILFEKSNICSDLVIKYKLLINTNVEIMKTASLSTVVGDEKLCARENDFRSLSLYVQSDENFGSKVLKVTKAKRLPFDVFDKLVSGFQFGIGIRLLQSVSDIGLVL